MGMFDVNNYIDPTWSTSIFVEEEKNQNEAELNKTRVEFIIEELEELIAQKRDQREQLLDQLQLLDVSIDRYDTLLIDIDAKIPPLLKNINDKLDELEAAYDNRITTGCRNSLRWVPIGWEWDDGQQIVTYEAQRNALEVVTRIENFDGSISEERSGLTDPNTVVKGYYGYKYYRKPLNRDFGSNLITNFNGSVVSGSSTIIALNYEFDSISGQDGLEIRIGDEITDGVEETHAWTVGNLPKVTGLGTTLGFSGITTTVRGSISIGSTILSIVGMGSTARATIGSGIGRTGILPDSTKVVGHGVGSTTYQYYDAAHDSNAGILSTTTRSVSTLILDNPAIGSTVTSSFNVGIVSAVPAIFTDSPASMDITEGELNVIRTAADIDKDFDFLKNPLDPVTIGIIDGPSKHGIGHTAYIMNNTHPKGPLDWRQVRCYTYKEKNGSLRLFDPEPLVGAGKVVYHNGDQKWPVIEDDGNTIHAFEGQIVIVKGVSTVVDAASGDGVYTGYVSGGGNLSITSQSPLNPSGATCTACDNAITAAEAAYAQAVTDNLNKAKLYAVQAQAIREVRDDRELSAYGLLQAAADTRKQLDKFIRQVNELKDLQSSEGEKLTDYDS